MENLGQGPEKLQIVEFENLYTDLSELKETASLQEKLVIANWVYKQIPLRNSLHFYSTNDCDPLYGRWTLRDKFKEMFPDFKFNDSYIRHESVRWTLFVIKKCLQSENKYVFLADRWYIYAVDKKDFDENWFMSQSLVLFKEPDTFWDSSISCSLKNWKIEYWKIWIPEWTLQWTCFVPIKISPNENIIYVWNKSYIYKSTLRTSVDIVTKNNIVSHNDENAIDLELGEIKKIALDAKQNLLFIVSEDEEWNSDLHILDHKKLFSGWNPVIDEIKKIEWVSNVDVLRDWNLILYRTDWKVDILNTNINSLDNSVGWWFKMKKIVVNKASNMTKKDVLDSLWWWTISLDDNEISNEWNEEDIKIIEWIWSRPIELNWTTSTLKELLDWATTEDEIENVRKWFLAIIKKNEKLSKVPELLKGVEKKINDKKNKIILENIFEELWDLADELWTAADLTTLITIQDKLKAIKKKRKNIQAWIIKEDKELDELLKVAAIKIKEYQEEHKDECEAEIENNLEKIKEFLDDIMNLIDISSIYANPLYEATKNMISNLSSESRDKYNKKLKEVINKRRDELRSESERIKKEEENRVESMKRDIEEDIEQIKETIEDVDNIEAIEQFKETDAFVQKIKETLAKLPSSDAQKLDLKLDRIFSERIFRLRLWWEEAKWVIRNLDSYWIDTILYYNEDWTEKVEWKIEWKENSNWTIWLVVKLMNWETHEFDKWIYLKDAEKFDTVLIWDDAPKFDMTLDEYVKFSKKLSKWRRSGKEELNTLSKKLQNEKDPSKKEKLKKEFDERKDYYKDARYTETLIDRLIKQQKLNPRSKVPPYDPDYIVLDEEKEILKELSARLVDQKQNSGIEILVWWPWLWKTVMCQFLANITNREIIRVQCSKMDPNDMFFAPSLKKWDLNYEPADWVKLMQKPGTIILFDEIDKLNAQCVERLHSLFDTWRSVYHWQLWTIKANPDCLFLWTRNLYDEMTNPMVNRGRMYEITYPWELNEAFKISKYTSSPILKKMSYEEFEMIYDKYITRWESAPTSAQEKKLYELVININHLLNVFGKLRELYWADQPLVYEVSYRDARQIFVDYNSSGNFKKALEKILIPKAKSVVSDPDEMKEQETMVKNAINEEMW